MKTAINWTANHHKEHQVMTRRYRINIRFSSGATFRLHETDNKNYARGAAKAWTIANSPGHAYVVDGETGQEIGI